MTTDSIIRAITSDAMDHARAFGYAHAEEEAYLNGCLRVELTRALEALAACKCAAAKQHFARIERDYKPIPF
jgi:hypothetical protein